MLIFNLKPNKQTAAFEQNIESQQLFKENLDILINKAERLYYDGDFESAYVICRKYKIMKSIILLKL